jgi:hemolysin activation/secretion protein
MLTLGVPATALPGSEPVAFTVERYVVEGENPLSPQDTESILSTHRGPKHGLDELTAAAKALEAALRARGFVLYRVYLPPQTIDQGTVVLKVKGMTIGSVSVSGNRYFSEQNVRRAVPPLIVGTTPSMLRVASALSLANDHPSRHISLNLKESRQPDTVDAELEVKDRKPWTVFSNFSNIGTPDIGRSRLSLGFQHTNLVGFDDAVTAIYTTSPENTSAVKQFGLNYRVPIYPLGGTAAFYYAHSDVNSGRIESVFDVSGAGDFYGLSYGQYLPKIANWRHQLGFGIEDRDFTNDVSFLGTPIGSNVRSRPINLRYDGEWRGEKFSGQFNLAYVRNLHGGANNNTASYARSRTGASRDWDLVRYGANVSYVLPHGFETRGFFEGQYAGEPLISGETFGVGGVSSVRGFEERGVTGDNGERLTFELWGPALPHGFRVLGFVDGARVERESPLPGEPGGDTIASSGLGLRWQWRENFACAFDYGHEFLAANDRAAGGIKWHVNLLVRY